MSDDLVSKYYEYLISSAEENGEQIGKPLFLLASLEYIVRNNLHGTTLNELMYRQHTRRIKELFLRAARNRIETPERTWRTITNPRNPEMQSMTLRYAMDHGDVSKAFAELKPSAAKHLLDSFAERLDMKNTPDASA